MTKHLHRIQLSVGWAEYDQADLVRVGDRLLPRHIDVEFPSAPDLPALSMKITVKDGVPVCTSVTIHAKSTGREVRTADLRAVKIEDWLEEIVVATAGEIVSEQDGVIAATYGGGEDAHRAATATIRAARSGSRRRITDDMLREVAELYRANITGRPVEAIVRAYGTGYRTAARYVQLAREAGHLPETSKGKRKA